MARPGQPSARWRAFVNERPIASIILIGIMVYLFLVQRRIQRYSF